MVTLRDVTLFLIGAFLSSFHVSACGDDEKPPRVPVFQEEQAKAKIPLGRLPQTTDAFVERKCWSPVDDFVVQCGYVTVSESPGSKETVELAVMRVFSSADKPATDPVVYLEGGPGAASVGSVGDYFSVFAPLAKDRDVIFVDQRGTGHSTPSYVCTEAGEEGEALDECYARLSETSDPASFNSAENARDLDAIRQAFGYDQWNLLGISYGTRLGLTLMRDFPDGIRSVILDAVVPLEIDLLADIGVNGQASFEEIFKACVEDAECAQKYPDSMTQLREVATKLNETPLDTPSGDLDGDTLLSILFNLAYSPVAVEFIPYLIDAVASGDSELLEDFSAGTSGGDFSFGMHLSVQCAEEFPFTSAEIIAASDADVFPELVAGLTGADYVDYCAHWPVPAAPAVENEPVVSSKPTLVFAGRFDPITPPRYSEMVHKSLPVSQFFTVSDESHGSSLGDCGMRLTRDFLKNPTDVLDAACLDDLPSLEFDALRGPRAKRTVGGKMKISTERPTPEQMREAIEDLQRRIHL